MSIYQFTMNYKKKEKNDLKVLTMNIYFSID